MHLLHLRKALYLFLIQNAYSGNFYADLNYDGSVDQSSTQEIVLWKFDRNVSATKGKINNVSSI